MHIWHVPTTTILFLYHYFVFLSQKLITYILSLKIKNLISFLLHKVWVTKITLTLPVSSQPLSWYPILLHTLLYLSYLVIKSSLPLTPNNRENNRTAPYLIEEIKKLILIGEFILNFFNKSIIHIMVIIKSYRYIDIRVLSILKNIILV